MNAPHISDTGRAMGCSNQAGPGPEPDASVRFAQELAGLALSLTREPCDQASSLAMITETAVKAIPGADCAAVVVPDSSGQLSIQAATGDLPLKVTELQQEIGPGPCLVALGQGAQVPDRDTASGPRSPASGERAAAIGVSGIVCAPLAIGQHTRLRPARPSLSGHQHQAARHRQRTLPDRQPSPGRLPPRYALGTWER